MKIGRLTKIFSVILAVMMISLPLCYAVWGGLEGDFRSRTLNFSTGYFFDDDVDDPLDRLPVDTPSELEGNLGEIQQSNDLTEDEFCGFVDTVISILNYIDKHELDSSVLVGSSVDDLFERSDDVLNNDFLVFVSTENGVSEIIVIHIDANSGFNIDSVDSLFYALERPWTGVNVASTMWLSGNLYTTFHAPVEFEGRYFLMNFDGPSGTPPTNDRNAWFELVGNFEYTTLNNSYRRNFIALAEGRHFVASQTVWGVSPLTGGWNPWVEILSWQTAANYSSGTMVKTGSGDDVRFWLALQNSVNTPPNEQNARLGVWREVSNAWIGRNGDDDVKSHYFAHNTYTAGTVVVCGISPRMNYRYFEAISNVPADCPPLISDGQNGLQVNTQYWRIYA